ncbi:kelch-like protein 18 [Centruroides sculpturatus]|uniref:kelch-like protein 18 n=1 Tax=Centruroides sculpturatus TaxID=218467 RepID=UPI000C6D58F5|nr:kelch-like protein 18 [Centruroides sculpturatus]
MALRIKVDAAATGHFESEMQINNLFQRKIITLEEIENEGKPSREAILAGNPIISGGLGGMIPLLPVFSNETSGFALMNFLIHWKIAVGAASLYNCLYVCGGYDGVSSLNTVECYNPDKDEWTMVTSKSKHRSAAGVVAFEVHIYALGGHNGLSIFEQVERYDPQTGQWTPMALMLTKRCRLGVSSLNGKIYVRGENDCFIFLQTAEVYDSLTKQ